MSEVAFGLAVGHSRRMKKLALLILPVLLSGCETTRILPAKVDGNEAFVSVFNVWTVNDALKYATVHCEKYGRIPRATGQHGYTVTFDCVPKGS